MDGSGPHSHDVSLATSLDFVNTRRLVRGELRDDFVSAEAAATWLGARGLVHDADVDAIDGPALERIVRARDAMHALADAAGEGRPPVQESLDVLNDVLRARDTIALVDSAEGLRLEHRHRSNPVDEALAQLAESLARELVSEDAARIRACASEDCRWIFQDVSPSGRRRWCDMASCGNRAKAARHRARSKPRPAGPRSDEPGR